MSEKTKTNLVAYFIIQIIIIIFEAKGEINIGWVIVFFPMWFPVIIAIVLMAFLYFTGREA
jgi:hypothetical protein